MESVGVTAVVEGLLSFVSDMGKMDKAIGGVGKSGTLLGNIFSKLGDVVQGLIGGVFRVLEYTLGNLIADAIETVISKIGDFIKATFELTNELARLQIMLNGLNLPANTEDIQDWDKALQEATVATKEQLDWLQQLAVAAPFEPGMISDIYVAIRAMGKMDTEARALTKDILEFAAGMGLSNEQAERISLNFRQMASRGKVTGTELRDLARGALLPLEDIFARMAKKMGITVKELTKQISTPEGVDQNIFLDAFQEMVREEPRFVGAMDRLGRTLEMATKNFVEFITNLGARNITLPIFNVLGEKIASITDQFVKFSDTGELIHTEKWDAVVDAATRIGNSLSDIIGRVLDLGGGAEGIADGIVNALDAVATWLETHSSDIVVFVQNALAELGKLRDWAFGIKEVKAGPGEAFPAGSTVTRPEPIAAVQGQEGALQGLLTKVGELQKWIDEKVIPAFDKISAWVTENGPLIEEFFETLGEIISEVFSDITSRAGKPAGEGGILESIKSFMQFVIDNKTEITKWVEILWSVFAVWTVLSTLFHITVVIITKLAGIVLMLMGAWTLLGSPIIFIIGLLISIAAPILYAIAIIAILITAVKMLQFWFEYFKGVVSAIVDNLIRRFTDWKENWSRIISEVMDAIKNRDWWGVGKALVDGIWRGIKNSWYQITDLARSLGQAALDAFNTVFRIHSPSGAMFDIGERMMQGLALGITDSANLAAKAMKNASLGVLMPAMTASNSVYNTVKNNQSVTNNTPTLNINSSAKTEPVIADFNMMQSLVGG